MSHPYSHLLSAALAAIALGVALGVKAEQVEYTATSAESAASYVEAVRAAEERHGAQSEQVVAPLLALANALAQSGHHEEAVPLYQRAVTIMRSQYGVFDVRQQDALKALAGSLTAMNRVSEAQDLLIYRAHVAERTYGEGSPQIVPTLCDLGDFFSEVGKAPEAHMTFNAALSIIGAGRSSMDPIIVEPLRGIARTYMRRMSYPGEWRILIAKDKQLRRDGEHALQRALRIVEADPNALTPATRIETLLQMGDWYQIAKSPREALPYYQRAWQLIRATPDLPASVSDALNVPLRVYYPMPGFVAQAPSRSGDVQSHHVRIEFNVDPDGAVSDARIVAHDTRDRYANAVLEAIRVSRFRPKFVDGEPVATPKIVYRESFWTAKTEE